MSKRASSTKLAEKKLRIKGEVRQRNGSNGKKVKGVVAKAYDKQGALLASAKVRNNAFDLSVTGKATPRKLKLAKNGRIVDTVSIGRIKDGLIDLGVIELFIIAPADWHIGGVVRDKATGNPLPGLTVEVLDVDQSGGTGPYYDPLGEDITDAAGTFNVWFDTSVFDREATWFGESYPDVIIKVRNSDGVIIHEMPVDQNVVGTPHDCAPYTAHKGKHYELDIDWVTAGINRIGPVSVADIDASGFATHGMLNGAPFDTRPFGGNTTVSGIIWGSKVKKWKLFCAAGFVDSADPRIMGLGPNSATPTGFTKLAEGTNKVWDGPIHKWNTVGLEGTMTAILVVWDEADNPYCDTQLVFLHNTAITPAAAISAPTPGSTVSKAAGPLAIEGTASDDHFRSYQLHWVGPTQTELTTSKMAYTPAGRFSPVVAGPLGSLNVSTLPLGPYCLRLSVHDRTVLNDDGDVRSDWTWNTITLTS